MGLAYLNGGVGVKLWGPPQLLGKMPLDRTGTVNPGHSHSDQSHVGLSITVQMAHSPTLGYGRHCLTIQDESLHQHLGTNAKVAIMAQVHLSNFITVSYHLHAVICSRTYQSEAWPGIHCQNGRITAALGQALPELGSKQREMLLEHSAWNCSIVSKFARNRGVLEKVVRTVTCDAVFCRFTDDNCQRTMAADAINLLVHTSKETGQKQH